MPSASRNEHSPRISSPGHRLSLSELEEIKTPSTIPPPIPSDAAERLDLDLAMKSAMESMKAPPPPSITLDGSPVAVEKKRTFPRWAQASLALAVGALVAFAAQRAMGPETETATATETETATATETASETETATASETETATASETETETATATASETETETATATASETATATETETAPASDRPRRPRPVAAATPATSSPTATTPATTTPAAPAAATTPANLPDHPSRENVQTAMEGVRGAVAACANGAHGLATLEITVHPSGRVQRALTGGGFAGTPEGSCMARAARSARFPAFSGEPFSLRYPYSL